jgi:hypothetical protein
MGIAAPGQDIQVRIGVSLQGVQEGKRAVDAVEPRIRKVRAQTVQVNREIDRADRSLRGVQKGLLKSIAKGTIAGAMTQGIESLTPNNDLNAFGFMKTLGTNVSMQSMFMGLRYGVYLGGILSLIQLSQNAIEALRERIQEERQRREKEVERLKAIDERFATKLQDLRDDFEEQVGDIRRRTYLELRNPTGS